MGKPQTFTSPPLQPPRPPPKILSILGPIYYALRNTKQAIEALVRVRVQRVPGEYPAGRVCRFIQFRKKHPPAMGCCWWWWWLWRRSPKNLQFRQSNYDDDDGDDGETNELNYHIKQTAAHFNLWMWVFFLLFLLLWRCKQKKPELIHRW